MQEIARTAIIGITKGLIESIPIIGNILTNCYDEYSSIQEQRKLNRLEELCISLTNDIQDLKSKINEDYVNNSEFLDVFEEVVRYVVNERINEKREMFKKILVNSIISEKCSYDRTEKYIKLLDKLGILELKILAVLKNPISFNIKAGKIIEDPNRKEPNFRNIVTVWKTYSTIDILKQLLNETQDDLFDSTNTLENEGLIVKQFSKIRIQTNGHPIHTLDDTLTIKGIDFVSFILEYPNLSSN